MDIPFQLSGWDSEARQLIEDEGCAPEDAVEIVVLRYLRAGDYRCALHNIRRLGSLSTDKRGRRTAHSGGTAVDYFAAK
jgi:hypothetical protein